VTTGDPPRDLKPADTLTREEQVENLNVLCEAIEKYYAQFELKSIDWNLVSAIYRHRLDEPMAADGFYRLLFELVNELRDTYSYLLNYEPPRPPLTHVPALAAGLVGGTLVVTGVSEQAAAMGVKPGWEILTVDGVNARERVDRTKEFLRACSTPWAFTRKACFYLLAGEQGSKATITLRSPAGEVVDCFLTREVELRPQPPREYPFAVTQQKCVHFGRHPSGLGYIHLASFADGATVAVEFDRALEALRDAPGLLLDIRDNAGGDSSANERVVGRLLGTRRRIAGLHWKSGPDAADFRTWNYMADPTGAWQYRKPVALLVNAVTAGAADVLASQLACCFRVVTIGEPTHGTQGSFGGTSAYAVLPCNLVVRISAGYVCGKNDRPVEGLGADVEALVEPSVEDLLRGTDPVLEKAVALLARPGLDADPAAEVEKYYAGVDQETKAYLREVTSNLAQKGLWVSEGAFQDLTPEQLTEKRTEWLAALNGAPGQDRNMAIECLGATRSTQALAKLAEIARAGDDNRARWLATCALGRLGDWRAIPPLIQLVGDDQNDVKRWARASLYRLTGQWFGEDKEAWQRWWNQNQRIDL
jgi:carboxyl-terminal processing protease